MSCSCSNKKISQISGMKKSKYKVSGAPSYENVLVGAAAAVAGATAGKFITAKLRPAGYKTSWTDKTKREALSFMETPLGITAVKAAGGAGLIALGAGLLMPMDDEMVQNAAIGAGLGLLSESISSYFVYQQSETDEAKKSFASIGNTNYLYVEEARPINLRRGNEGGSPVGNLSHEPQAAEPMAG